MSKKITNHKMFTQADYNYFTSKDYTNKEILAFWDRDLKEGKAPQTVNKYTIDFGKTTQILGT